MIVNINERIFTLNYSKLIIVNNIIIDVANKYNNSKLGKFSNKFTVTITTFGANLIYTNVINPIEFIMDMIDDSPEDVTSVQYSPM
jgi:hypothetical protein